jgi:hypothetical protein
MEKRWTSQGWEWNIGGVWKLGRKSSPFTSFLTPKPSPFEWPVRLSTEVSKYPELVDPELFAQAKAYSSHVQRLTAEGFTPAAAAKTLQQRGYRFFGWSKKLLSDIQAPSVPPSKLSPEFVSRWNREALLTRLSTAVKQGPFEPVPMPEFYRQITTRAQRFGLSKELLSRIGPGAPEMLSEMISPSPWYQKALRTGKQLWGSSTRFKVGLGLAVGLLGLYALKPGSWFSGKDDTYNTIEGLGHSGIAWQQRMQLTDFGSGYQDNRNISPAEMLVGTGLTVSSFPYVLGYKNVYHGTSSADIANKIRQEGLFSSFGGRGVNTFSAFRETSKGFVHVTPRRFMARIFAAVDKPAEFLKEERALKSHPGKSIGFLSTSKERKLVEDFINRRFKLESGFKSIFTKAKLKSLNIFSKEVSQRTLSIKLPVEQWKRFEVDKHLIGDLSILKEIGARTSGDISPEFIVGGKGFSRLKFLKERFSNLSSYIKSYPLRFGLGVVSVVGGIGLIFSGFQEKGEAKRKRQELTDFGSGYRGLDFNRDDTVSPVERKFGRFTRALKKYGVEAGTAHKRIYIPKDIVSEEELTEELGFIPVKIAIPEAGQTRFESFRHPNVLYHLHEHGDVWVMHEDVHPSATMVFKKWMAEKAKGTAVSVGGLAKNVWASMSHIFEEGIPGAYYYLRGLIFEADDMRKRIEQEISTKYKGLVKRWRKEFSKDNVFSGFGKAYNTIEGLFHGGQAEKKRRELTDFGSGAVREKLLQRGIQLFRGTKEKIGVHFAVGEKSVLANIPRQVENIFEAIRKTEFQYRPSRLESSFWTISPHEAVFYTKGGTEPTISRITRTIEDVRQPFIGTFFTRSDIVSEAAIIARSGGPKTEIETLARQYWKGLKPSEVEAIVANPKNPDYRYVESLIPGKIETERQWAIEEGKWKYLKPKVFEPYVPSAQTLGMKAERMALDIENRIQKKHLEAVGVERVRYLSEEQKQAIREEIRRKHPWESKILGFYKAGEFDKLEKEAVARFSAKDDFYNTIMGLSEKGIAGKNRKINTDFGSGWRGLFSKIVRPFTFAGRVERVYKGLIKSSLKAQGVSTRNLVWDYTDILEKGALDITLMAKTKAGDPLAVITRILSPKEVYLTSLEVGTKGAGLGKKIYAREALALRKLGYKAGTRIVSSVSSPITARWQAQLYGSQSVNKLVEDDFINRLIKGKITKQEFQSKYAGEFAGELRFDGFQEQGLSSLFRKKYGFGSGTIWKKILTFSRKLFGSSTSKTSFEKLTSAMTESEVANIFGREAASFNPAQIRSGLMDKWYVERKLGLPREVVTRSPAEIRKEMELGEQLYNRQVVQGKIFSRNELRTMRDVEWAEIRKGAIAKQEARVQKNAARNAEIKKQMMGVKQKTMRIKKQQTLHLKAQQDFWKNSVKTGRGHVIKSSNTTVA